MLFKKEDHCPYELDNGIVIDYVQGSFVMLVKDDVWTDYEIDAFHHHKLNLYFLYQRVCAIFLLENVDSIDTSDASFDIHNCDCAQEILAQEQYSVEAYLINKENIVCAGRSLNFDKAASKTIHDALKKQMDTPYDDAGFDRALEKIQGTYEPFEMEELALIKVSF